VPRRGGRILALVAMLVAGPSGAASAGDLYVICNAGVSLQAGDARDMFVGEKAFAGVVKLQPADNAAAQAEFLEKVLKVDAAKYAVIWTKKSFRDGANPPPLKGSDAEALAYVKATPGGCSYVSNVPAGGVTIVGRF
jgi:hypothetical protein